MGDSIGDMLSDRRWFCKFGLQYWVQKTDFVLGYYTRSGYVPGPICKYNWTKVWEVADQKNKYADPKIMDSVSVVLFIFGCFKEQPIVASV